MTFAACQLHKSEANVKSKAPLELQFASGPLIPTFAICLRQGCANVGIGPLASPAWRRHEEPHYRPLGFPGAAQGRGHYPSVRQSRHHRIADHACAEGPSRPHLCDGHAGEPGGRDRRRLLPRLRQAGRLQRPCRAGAGQCAGFAVQRGFHRHADDSHRRATGAGPRADGAGAVRPAGADGRAPGEMGGRGDASGRSAAHRAPRRQDRDHAADRPRLHLAARRYPQFRSRHRARPLHPRRHPGQAVG